MDYPDPPTRIVEPEVDPPIAVPTPAVCVECTAAGNEALAKAAARGKKPTTPADEPESPTPES